MGAWLSRFQYGFGSITSFLERILFLKRFRSVSMISNSSSKVRVCLNPSFLSFSAWTWLQQKLLTKHRWYSAVPCILIMIKQLNLNTLTKLKEKLRVKKPWDSIIIFALNILIAIPVFIIIHQNIVDPEWPLHLDRILIFIVLVTAIQLILRLVKTILIVVIFLYLIALSWGTLFGN